MCCKLLSIYTVISSNHHVLFMQRSREKKLGTPCADGIAVGIALACATWQGLCRRQCRRHRWVPGFGRERAGKGRWKFFARKNWSELCRRHCRRHSYRRSLVQMGPTDACADGRPCRRRVLAVAPIAMPTASVVPTARWPRPTPA
jgi:hypothetical protein